MKHWNDIRKQIRKAEEPLSHNAWQNMESMLPRKGNPRWWLLGGLLLLLLPVGWWAVEYSHAEAEDHYQPRSTADKVLSDDTDSVYRAMFHQQISWDASTQGISSPATVEKGISVVEAAQEVGETYTAFEEAGVDSAKKVTETKNLAQEVRQSQNAVKTERGITGYKLLSVPEKSLARLPLGFPAMELLPVSSLGAEVSEAKQEPQKARLELRLFVAPTYNQANISYHQSASATHRDFAEAAADAIKPGWGVDAGAELRYRIFGSFHISSGIAFRKLVTQNNFDYSINEIPVQDSASGDIIGYLPASNPVQVQQGGSNTYTFIDVPLSLYYEYPLSERFTLTAEAINHISFLVEHSGYGIDQTTLELQEQQDGLFNNVVNAYQIRLGLRYQVSRNFYLALQPAYRSYYQDFFKSDKLSWKPSDFSLGLSGIIRLK